MLINTTHKSINDYPEVDLSVGKRFSLLKRIKIGGVGSKRMIIDLNASVLPSECNKINNDELMYGSLEIRSKGVIVHLYKSLKSFSYVIPYYKLIIFKTPLYSFYSDKFKFKFIKSKSYLENKAFFEKIIDHKSKFSI